MSMEFGPFSYPFSFLSSTLFSIFFIVAFGKSLDFYPLAFGLDWTGGGVDCDRPEGPLVGGGQNPSIVGWTIL